MKTRKLFIALYFILSTVTVLFNNISAQGKFKILSYNILYGLQNDTAIKSEFVKWVKILDPDIIAFEEMNSFTQKSIEEFAARYGHSYAVISKTEGFPVALTSKYPIVNVQKVVDNMHHAYLYANVNGINVIVIHFSPFSYQKRQREVKEILARAALIPKNEKTVIMGDFNSLALCDAPAYTEEAIAVLQARELKESNIRNLNNQRPDYTVTGAMLSAGYIDILKQFHPEFQLSVPTKKYGDKNPKRIDYMWFSPRFAKSAVTADFIYDDVTNRISDHYPLFVTLNLK